MKIRKVGLRLSHAAVLAGIFFVLSSESRALDLTLKQALQEAYTGSPRIQKSRSVYAESSWKRVETYSGFLPSITASSSYLTAHRYVLTDISFGGSPTSVPGVIPTSNFVLQAQLPLFDGFASTNRYLSSKFFESAAQKEMNWTEFQVSREVSLQYFKALGARTLKEVAEQNVKMLEDHLHDVNLFKKAGVSTNYDVLRVEVQVSEARSELLNSGDNVELARNRLGETLGHESEERELTGELPSLTPELIANVELKSVAERKDIQANQDRVEAYQKMESGAAVYWVPKVNLFGQYQYYNNVTEGFSDRDKYREAYQVGVNLTWNLFDGMSSIAKSKESIEQRVQVEKSSRIALLKAKQDLEFWKRKYIYFCSVSKSRINDVQKASESVRLAKEGRRVGARTNTDLLDAEGELFRAKAGLVTAQVGAVEALISLELATGQKIYDFN
jgi:outer membrane protein TolC